MPAHCTSLGLLLTLVQIIPPRSSTQAFLRCKSNRSPEEDRWRTTPGGSSGADADIFGEIEKGEMSLEERLEHMGIDAAEYKQLKVSAKAAQGRFDRWTPKTKAEAQKKWKQLADAPEDITLLEMFKKEGVDVLAEGK